MYACCTYMYSLAASVSTDQQWFHLPEWTSRSHALFSVFSYRGFISVARHWNVLKQYITHCIQSLYSSLFFLLLFILLLFLLLLLFLSSLQAFRVRRRRANRGYGPAGAWACWGTGLFGSFPLIMCWRAHKVFVNKSYHHEQMMKIELSGWYAIF